MATTSFIRLILLFGWLRVFCCLKNLLRLPEWARRFKGE